MTTKAMSKSKSIASQADRHSLYQNSVQDTDAELGFIEETFTNLNGRKLRLLREDFCGTANTACDWVRRHKQNHAVGLDLDEEVLEWGRLNNVATLSDEQSKRIQIVHADVMQPPSQAVDAVIAMNFSYYLFKQRDQLRQYFRQVHASLVNDGIFFMDAYGGYEAHQELEEDRDCEDPEIGKFQYIWDQHSFNPINHHMNCQIHFKFPDGSKIQRAFDYDWRLWSLPELQEILTEAGFSRVYVYWEGTDEDSNEGDGVYSVETEGDADAGWICYLVAQH